jgi:hypothetical protein
MRLHQLRSEYYLGTVVYPAGLQRLANLGIPDPVLAQPATGARAQFIHVHTQ